MTLPVRGRVPAALLLALLLLHAAAVVIAAGRDPHVDEVESLHAAWLVGQGDRLYVDFFEHHSPFFFATLAPLTPGAELAAVRGAFERARWLCGAFGLVALAAYAAAAGQRAAEAAPIAVALVLATGPLWNRGFAEVRAEAFALAFFWGGTLLALRGRPAAAGAGLGLVAVSCLWQPKWPLSCVAVGAFALYRLLHERSRRELAAAAAGAIATTGAAFVVLAALVPLDRWWFFMFEVNAVLARAAGASQSVLDAHFQGGVPFLLVPSAFHPWLVVPAAAIVAAAAFVERTADRVFFLLLLAASFVELRFVYPWPVVWSHYYMMWGLASAAIFGLLPSALATLLHRLGATARVAALARTVATAGAFALVVPHIFAVLPLTRPAGTYWVSQQWFRERLRPGEVVWVEPFRHPVTVRDAHYYWFLPAQMSGAAAELRKSERGRRHLPPPEPLPVCAPPPNLRYTLDARRAGLPDAARCMQRLIDSGAARRTVFFDVWEIRLKSATQ